MNKEIELKAYKWLASELIYVIKRFGTELLKDRATALENNLGAYRAQLSRAETHFKRISNLNEDSEEVKRFKEKTKKYENI